MNTLVEFLLARVTDDEARVEVAALHLETGGDSGFGGLSPEVWDHLRRYRRSRVLAECEAKRRIVAEHAPEVVRLGKATEPSTICHTCRRHVGMTAIDHPCPTLRLLALPYADHPDYREEWKL